MRSYTVQRYYASAYGRFNTADPYRASGGAAEPGSWNRYAYVEGDPVNWLDSGGTNKEAPPTEKFDGPTFGTTSYAFDFRAYYVQNLYQSSYYSAGGGGGGGGGCIAPDGRPCNQVEVDRQNNERCHQQVGASKAAVISRLQSSVAAITTINDIVSLAVNLGAAATTGYEAAAVSIAIGATASLPEALLVGAAAAGATYFALKVLGIPEDKLVDLATGFFVSTATTIYGRVAAAQAAQCDTLYKGGR